MKGKELKDFITFNNIRIGSFVSFNNDNKEYAVEGFAKEDKILVNNIESGQQRLKKIEDVSRANRKNVVYPKKKELDFDGGIVIYTRNNKVYILNLDREFEGKAFIKPHPALEVFKKDGDTFSKPIESPFRRLNIHTLPGFIANTKRKDSQQTLPGFEIPTKEPKGGMPVLFNVTKNIKDLKTLKNNSDFKKWFYAEKSNINERTKLRLHIRNIINEIK